MYSIAGDAMEVVYTFQLHSFLQSNVRSFHGDIVRSKIMGYWTAGEG